MAMMDDPDRADDQVHERHRLHPLQGLLIDRFAVEPDRPHGAWMRRGEQLPPDRLDDEVPPQQLDPPAVDPVEPPMNIATSRTTWAPIGQAAKSTLAYPVVVTIASAWKVASTTAVIVVVAGVVAIVRMTLRMAVTPTSVRT
jgi:hypothetical protein